MPCLWTNISWWNVAFSEEMEIKAFMLSVWTGNANISNLHRMSCIINSFVCTQMNLGCIPIPILLELFGTWMSRSVNCWCGQIKCLLQLTKHYPILLWWKNHQSFWEPWIVCGCCLSVSVIISLYFPFYPCADLI